MAVETEIKLPVVDLAAIKRQLRRLGWRVTKRRTLERNWVFDRKDRSLRRGNRLLRVRRVGSTAWLTVKGPSAQGTAHKVRDEFEIETRNADVLMKILETLDYRVTWRYEKYRGEFAKPGERERSCSTRRLSGISWNWKAPRRGSTRPPDCWAFSRPIT